MVAAGPRIRGDIARALRTARGQDGVTLADTIGIDRHHLSHIEAGRRTGIRHLHAFAQALDVDPDVLLGRTPAIAALREAAGHTPDQFANHIGVTPARLAKLERGADLPDDRLAEVIAIRLGVPLSVVRPRRVDVAA